MITNLSEQISSRIGFRVELITAAQSITNGAATAIIWNSDLEDPFGMTSGTTITIPPGQGGIWRISYCVQFASNATGIRQAYVETSAPEYPGVDRRGAVNGTATNLSSSFDISLAAGVTFSLKVVQSSGGALDVNANTKLTFMSGYRIK